MLCKTAIPSPVELTSIKKIPSARDTSQRAQEQQAFSTATSARSSSSTPASSRKLSRSPAWVVIRSIPASARSLCQRFAWAPRSSPVRVHAIFTPSAWLLKSALSQVPDSAELLTIGQVAQRAGRAASSLRYYEQIGLIPTPIRLNGRRHYRPDILRTLAVIETAQRAGLNLDEIRLLLQAAPGDKAAIERLREVAERKLPELRATIERAELVLGWLEHAARCDCPSLDDCPLFDESTRLPERQAAFA